MNISFFSVLLFTICTFCNFLLISTRHQESFNNFETEKKNKEIDSIDISFIKKTKLQDEYGQEVYLDEIIKKTGCSLVLVLSSNYCSPCFSDHLSNFKEARELINKNNIILITEFNNLRDLILFKKTQKVAYKCYNQADIENKNFVHSTYFYINKELRIQDITIIKDQTRPETIKYFKFINHKINQCL